MRRILRKTFGVLFLIMAVGSLSGAVGDKKEMADVVICIIAAAMFVFIGLILLLKNGKTPEQRKARKAAVKERKDRQSRTLSAHHMAGLPLAEGVFCTLEFDDECVMIIGGGNTFRVSFNKITNLQTKTKTEIQKSYVSSIGGAMVGAFLFGSLGAIVGGRAKEKTSTISEYFFIITYNKDGAVDYVSFGIDAITKASKLIRRYKPFCTGETIHMDL